MRIKEIYLIPVILLIVFATPLFAAASFGARENSQCLECHGEHSIVDQGGERLYVDPFLFANTTHKVIGCVSCHDSVTDRHPEDGAKPSHASCQECHGAVIQEYAKSLHGKNANCTDCHNPHQARKLAYVSGVEVNAMCSRCHKLPKTVENHKKWLPQAAFHLDMLPCITCHTSSKNYFINLFIEKQDSKGEFHLVTYDELSRLTRENGITYLINTNGDTFISLQELRKVNKMDRPMGVRLRAILTPEVMTHNFQILANRRNCTFCHVSGTRNSVTSFVSFPTAAGTYKRVPVEKGALLDIFYGTPDFYMTGATRSIVLSIIGAIILACGVVIPLGHGTLRFLTRKRRIRKSGHPGKEVLLYMETTPVRIWHWFHALGIVTLFITGIQIRFPDVVNLFGSYKATVYLHNTAGVVVGISMIYWTLYYVVISHNIGRVYFPTGEDVKHGIVRQAIYYAFNYFRGKPNPFHATPENKFNALQKMAYLVVMLVLMPLVVVTGLLLLEILPLRRMLFMLGGIRLIDGLHFLSASCLCAFTVFHFYLTTLGPTPFAEIRTMWTGWAKEEASEDDGPVPPTDR